MATKKIDVIGCNGTVTIHKSVERTDVFVEDISKTLKRVLWKDEEQGWLWCKVDGYWRRVVKKNERYVAPTIAPFGIEILNF